MNFTERTTLGVSLRYDEDKREQTNAGDPAKAHAQPDVQRYAAARRAQPQVQRRSTRLRDVRIGFRSGGFNGVGGRPFRAETLDSFELGYKSTVAGRSHAPERGRVPSRSDDYQFFYIDFNQGGAQVIDNLSEVEFVGGEVEWQAQLSQRWQVYGSVGVLDSDIRKFDPTLTVPTQRATARRRRSARASRSARNSRSRSDR